jgi:hypothetical protein
MKTHLSDTYRSYAFKQNFFKIENIISHPAFPFFISVEFVFFLIMFLMAF